MKEKLTLKQERVLNFLKSHINHVGYPPTMREIASKLGIAGPNSAKKFLDILQRKGYIRRTARSSRAIEIVGERTSTSTRVLPILGKIRAGRPLLAVENIEGTMAVDSSLVRGDAMFILKVEGDSMIEAQIRDGDLAVIRQQPQVDNGEIAVVLIEDEATIKYFFREKGMVCLQPANPAMKPIIIKEGQAEVRILGKMVALIRYLEGGHFIYGSISG